MSIADQLARQYDDVIDLSLGDPDLTTDEIIINGAFEDAKKGHTKYTDFRGDPELRMEIAKFYKEEYGMDVADDEIFVTSSGTHAMCLAFSAILDEGDEVIIHAPYYTYYTTQIKFARGIPVVLDCLPEEGFQINPQRLRGLITERTKAIVVNTPNNPTGANMSRETLEAVAEIAKEFDLAVIADDIYTAYSFEGAFTPIASLPGMFGRTITLNSYSKDYTMTGWRVGQIVAPNAFIRAVNAVNDAVMFTAPSVSQRAAIYALRNRKTIQPPMIEEYKKRVYYAAERVNGIKNLSVLTPKGTFYLMIDIRKTGLTSAEAMERILSEAHVLVMPGPCFGDCGEGFVRIACTKKVEALKEAFDRLETMEILMQ